MYPFLLAKILSKGGKEEMTISIRLTEDEEKKPQRLVKQIGFQKNN